jgi:hypothetical protein
VTSRRDVTTGIDLDAATSFLATHARILDRRRFDLLLGNGDADGALAALDGYRNLDGGYGWGLEPDLRSPESQPAAAMHAFEVFAEAGPATTHRAAALCDWLHSISLSDGGLPFALPVGNPAGCAPFWVGADQTVSSLQITAVAAAKAHRVAVHDRAVAEHPWLSAATDYCLRTIEAVTTAPHAYELSFALQFLDAVAGARPEAAALLQHIGRHVPSTGTMHVEGGAEDEALHPLDFAPDPHGHVRTLLAPGVISADLDRLVEQQQPDGGWPIEWVSSSPAAALEWRGYVTVRAISILQANSRLR